MPRKKPTSTRQKKEERQLRRAIKRGDISPPPPRQPHKTSLASASLRGSSSVAKSSRKLQSSFIKVTSKFLEETKALSSVLPLCRPIPTEAAISKQGWADDTAQRLISPRRPKWNFEMSKEQVESNEEGVFKKWLHDTDSLVERWLQGTSQGEQQSANEGSEDQTSSDHGAMPRSPSYFERNLEVWRQLWRVTEISQIVLVLLDCRCPLLHFPPSLATYLSHRRIILVLTKVDIAGKTRTEAWITYFRSHYPDYPIVQVESYTLKQPGSHHQGRAQYEPCIPGTFREELVMAIRKVHEEMKELPEKLKADPNLLKRWKSPVRREIDWDAVLAVGDRAGNIVEGAITLQPQTQENASEDNESVEPEFLTVGLIGQPNVGKSSLLNALFGKHKVRASKTPGKTKHFQTLFWTSDVRLVDCPGLILPNYVPMEMQVLSGVLPIARVSAIPACIHYACQLLPLEEALGLTHPNASEPLAVDKRTWREGMKRAETKENLWTAMDILVAYANQKGWLTAKAGRPDVSRAGNALLRALAEGRLPWAFWPPGTPLNILEHEMGHEIGHGIWIRRDDGAAFDVEGDISSDGESTLLDDSNDYDFSDFSDESTEYKEDESRPEEKFPVKSSLGRFAVLSVVEDEDENENSYK